jgi:hypothetical protein
MAGFDFSRLTRPIRPMPEAVRRALTKAGLMRRSRRHPACRQNDYLA